MNHALLNDMATSYYQPTQGIFPHTDGPATAYASCTVPLSLGCDTWLNFTKRWQTEEVGVAGRQQRTRRPRWPILLF
jgi:hypothetical protein